MVKSIANITKILGKHLKRLSKDGLDSFIKEFCVPEPPQGITQMEIKHLEGKTPVEVVEKIMKFYTVRHVRKRVKEALRNINENQIRMDLEKELRADGAKKKATKAQIKVENAPGPSGGPAIAADQQMNVGASQQPGGDNKPKRGRKSKAAPGPSGGPAIAAGKKMKVGASQQPGGDNKPKRGRKPKTDEKEHFVTENRTNLIRSIANIDPVLDHLMDKKLLTQEDYDRIRRKGTNQEKMRELYDCVRSWGNRSKDTFLKILEKYNSDAIKTLLVKSKRKK